MSRTLHLFALVMIACASLAIVGCNDQLKAKEAHIALIEDTNQQLTEELAAARAEADELARQRDELSSRALAFQGQVDDLNARLAAQPEQAVSEGWQAVPGGAMIAIEGSVLFPSGKAKLRPAGRSSLEAIGRTITSRYADKDVFVFGHTDDTPIKKSGWTDNYELSAQRALSVVRYLRDHGVPPERLVACGAGEHRPVVGNTSDQNRAKNRRVEIFAVEPIDR